MPPRRSRSTASVEAPVDVLGTPEHVPASTDAESVDKLPIGFPTREPLPAFVPQVPVWWRGKNPKKANRLLRVTSVIAVVLIFGGLIVRYRDFFLVWEFSWDKTSTLALAAGAFLLAAGPILARRVNNKLARSALGASDKKFIDAKAQFDFEVVNGGFDRDEHALSKLLADASADELLDNLTYPKQLSDFPAALAALNAAAGHGAPVLPGPAAADSAVSVAVAAAAGASEGEGDDSDAAPVPRSRGRKAAAAPAAAAAAPRSRGRKSSAAATAAAAAAAAAAAESGDEAEEKDEHGSNATALVSVSPAAPAAAISDAEVAATPDATAADSASASVSSAAVALSAQLRRLIRASQPAYAVRSDEPQPTEPLPSGRAVPVAGRVHPSKPGSSFPREAATLLLSSAAAQRKQSLKPALSEMDAELVLNLAAQAGALPEDCSALQLARLWDTALRPPRVLVFEWDGDLLATETPLLASFVDFAVKTCAPGKDEVVLLLESGGGAVPHYGRAAYELARLRQHGVHLTVCVDKVAASGGYMMAAVADRIVAAPFAYVGSVGVIAQIPNISKVLKKNDVDMLQFTAGRYKRTVTMLGEVTSEGKRKLQEDLDVIHRAFSDHVGLFRPQLVPRLPEITTGEVWLGRDALALGLVDAVAVASEVVQQATRAGLVIRVKRAVSKPTRLMQWIFGDSDGASAGAVAAAVAALASAVATVVRALAPAGLGLGLGLGVGAGAAGTGAVVGAPHAAALEALALAAAAHPHAHAAVAMPPTAAANFARFA